LNEITELSLEEDKEYQAYKPNSRKRNRWIAVGIVGLLLLGGSFAMGTVVNNSTDNMALPVTPAEMSDVNKQELSAGISYSTTQQVGDQIALQYGEGITETVLLASSTSDVDENGKPAIVALTTYSNVPSDFDIQNSSNFFIEGIKGFEGSWTSATSTIAPDGIDSIYSLKLYDTSAVAVNPAIVDISYFTETNNNPDKNITITISVTAY
jgi:hypothetical protein